MALDLSGKCLYKYFLLWGFPLWISYNPYRKIHYILLLGKKHLVVGFCLLVMFCFHFAITFLSVRNVPALLHFLCLGPPLLLSWVSSLKQLLILNNSQSPMLYTSARYVPLEESSLQWKCIMTPATETAPFGRAKITEIFKKFCLWSLKKVDLQTQISTNTELDLTQNIYYDSWLDPLVHSLKMNTLDLISWCKLLFMFKTYENSPS